MRRSRRSTTMSPRTPRVLATPSVSAIGPPAGNVKGGRTVTIWGSGFAGGGSPSVSFGGVASPRVRVLHDYEIRARVPAESPSTACASGNEFAPVDGLPGSGCRRDDSGQEHDRTHPAAAVRSRRIQRPRGDRAEIGLRGGTGGVGVRLRPDSEGDARRGRSVARLTGAGVRLRLLRPLVRLGEPRPRFVGTERADEARLPHSDVDCAHADR